MSFTWPPGSTTRWAHGWPGHGLRPRGLSLGAHALGGTTCTAPLAFMRLHATCRLWNPSPQDTEHSDHGLANHLGTKNYRRLVRTGCQASAALRGRPAKDTPVPMSLGGGLAARTMLSLVLRLPFPPGSSRLPTRTQQTEGSGESRLQGLSPVWPPRGRDRG